VARELRGASVGPAEFGTIRLFLSSTFEDMRAERDHLITVVYPEFEERLALLDLAFFDVDLRWGIPRSQDVDLEEPRNSWEECRQRIDSAFPFFVSLLGQRYGSIPRREELTTAEVALWGCERSYTELEIRYGAFAEHPDRGARAESRRPDLNRRSAFYFRAPPEIPKDLDRKAQYAFDEMRQVYVQETMEGGEKIEPQAKLDALRDEIGKRFRHDAHARRRWPADKTKVAASFANMNVTGRSKAHRILRDSVMRSWRISGAAS